VAEVSKMIQELGIGEIVIGESKNYQGESNEVMKDAAEFAAALAQATNLPVYNEPEFMTSHQAERTQHELTGGSSRGKVVNRDMLDASAAAIILQSYLDRIAVPAIDVD
jgi:putative transcription antitermination factor YqgF